MKRLTNRSTLLLLLLLFAGFPAMLPAFVQPSEQPLPSFDNRKTAGAVQIFPTADQQQATAQIRARIDDIQVDFDSLTGAPNWICNIFSAGRRAYGRNVAAPGSAGGKSASSREALRLTAVRCAGHAYCGGQGRFGRGGCAFDCAGGELFKKRSAKTSWNPFGKINVFLNANSGIGAGFS